MRLPVSEVNVLGERYRVRVHPFRDRAYGECHYDRLLITVDPRQSRDCARDTLLHEVVHAIDHVGSLRMTEEQVRAVATGLRSVFTANPKFARFVCE